MAPKVSGALAPRSALAPRPKIDLESELRKALGQDDERDKSLEDIIDGLHKLEEQREACHTADEMYDGDVGMVFASQAVQRILERAGVDAIDDFNYAHIPVDAIAKRLQISSVVAAPAEENAEGQQAEEDAATAAANRAIAALRKTNELDAEEKRLHHIASLYGEAYAMVWPGEDTEGKPTVDIRVNSPHHVVMVYDEEDALKARYVLKSWRRKVGDKEITRATLYYPDRIERWTTKAGGNPDKREDWYRLAPDEIEELDVEEDDELADLAADEFYDPDEDDAGSVETPSRQLAAGEIANPYQTIPWFHFRNNRPHGVPEHKNAYGPQVMINKIVYALAGNIDFTSLPQKWILVDPTQDDPLQNMVDPDHPDDEDDPEDTGGSSGLRHSPGEVWKLFGKSVGEFAAADPSGLIALLDRCIKAIPELTGLPQYAFSRTSSDLPSGEAVRELNGDLNATVKDRQDRYDPKWQDIYEFALKLLGITGVTVDVRWSPIQMVNDMTGWQVIQAKINAGVPPQVALEEAGYAREQVETWLKDASGADVGRRVALLGQMATAAQAFGAAIVTGAMSAPQVQQVISGMLGLTMEGTDIKIPEAGPDDFVDPQAALKAQQEAQDKQLQAQQGMQRTQLDHATETQKAAHENARQMAEEGHQRAKEMFGQQAKANGAQQGQNSGGRGPARRPAPGRPRRGPGNSGGR